MRRHPTLAFGITLELAITDMHFSGVGTGFHPGYGRIYVPFAYPGETIEIKLREKIKGGHWNGERAAPPSGHCAVAGSCGGCSWPGAPYAGQVEWKKALLIRELKGVPGISDVPIVFHQSDQLSGMRSRIHLHASFFRGRFEFGFYARGSRQVVAISDCPMAEQAIRDVICGLDGLRSMLFPGENFGFGVELIHLPEEGGRVLMLLYGPAQRRDSLRKALPVFANISPAPLVRIAFEPDAPFFVWERFRNIILYTKPGCFQQVNRRQTLVVRSLIAERIAAENPRILLDLYSGSGNYSLPFHADVDQIFGCDENAVGIEVAAVNTMRNRIQNCRYICGDASEVLKDRVAWGWPEHADLVIADPARQGMGIGVIEQLPGLKARTLVYIAHHRATFARDAKFLATAGFQLARLHLVDFFPFTPQLNIVSFWVSG